MRSFYDWVHRELQLEITEGWQETVLKEIIVHTDSQRWEILLAFARAVPLGEIHALEDKITLALQGPRVEIRPLWEEPEVLLGEIIEQRSQDLQLAAGSATGDLFDPSEVVWRITDNKLDLVARRREVWEELVENDVCCRLAEWFVDEYGVMVLVKTSCREQMTGCHDGEPGLVRVKENLYIEGGSRKNGSDYNGKRSSTRPVPAVAGPVTSLHEIDEGMGRVTINGKVFACDSRPLKGSRRLFTYAITDFTDSITVKQFVNDNEEIAYGPGDWLLVQGHLQYDNYEHETVLIADLIRPGEEMGRRDQADQKRVELHAHTVMSALDGMTPVADLVTTAARWGHPAVAITDHGVVQAFPEAYQVGRKAGIKVILGMEGYLVDDPRQSRSYHIIILARDYTGLRNLYKLVSRSYLDHFYRTPRITRQDLIELREGLIIGSACEAGELFQAVLAGASDEELTRLAAFYDYLEIQPLGNNQFMIREGRVSGEEELKAFNRRLVDLGRRLGKPVVATGDVHFLNPEDEIYRRILQAGKSMEDAEEQPPLFLRTTEEMLEEFSYLGPETAHQVVVENPAAIASQIEDMKPVPDELYTPTIEGADELISGLSRQKACELYGDPLPELVEQRLNRELDSIVGHGFSNLYYIAHKLVKKSNEDGYLVGSRGSVGSSLVAFLTGITEVNPLPPHYVCPDCRYSEFVHDEAVGCGIDMPPRNCPRCGCELRRDGFDIAFETFLGFDGDKVPDIDLNFSGEYQPHAHQYVEELFGRDKVFRAGTISTIAEKTAFGFVKKYMETKQVRFRNAEVTRLVSGITGVKRTTGQHPGGLMIVPREKDVHEFTPLQHPADDPKSGVITTHFDYHSISERLVKVDILGHDDPTMIRTLTDLTGFDARRVPLDEPRVMSLFSSTEALGVTPREIRSEVGTYGVPEFGTKFVRQMLEATRPKTLAELIRICGLAHGTDVWLNNAQTLISTQTATLNEVTATRDDIMIYLINKGLPKKLSFKIMENVRKGKGLTEEHISEMQAHQVPEWYIESCKKISYLFPKAHAVAYVISSYRIAYYKVYYPQQYYAAYFSVRAEDFDAEAALAGYDRVAARLTEIEKQGNNAPPKERNLLPILELTLEALARGVKFLNVDLWRSDAQHFQVTDQGILLPFTSLAGLGIQAGRAIVEARQQSPFTSVEDLQARAHLSSAVMDILRSAGCLRDLPESSQIALFA